MKAGKILLTLAILAMAAGVGQAQNNRTRNVSRATRHTLQKKERVLKDTDDTKNRVRKMLIRLTHP